VAHAIAAEKNPQLYAQYYQTLATSGMLDSVAKLANQMIRWPRTVALIAVECGTANAFFNSTSEPYPAVVLCYEFMNEIAEEFRYDNLTAEQINEAIYSTVVFVLLHEIGHAAIHELELPVLGREEDAVDGFAALLLSQGDTNYAVWAAEYWMQRDDLGDTGLLKQFGPGRTANAFADEHGLDEQRFYNIICWTYGAAPEQRRDLLARRSFPKGRADRCPSEYAQLQSSWNGLLEAHRPNQAQSTETSAPATASRSPLLGVWRFTESFADPTGLLISCANTGTITTSQMSNGIAGEMTQSGSCRLLGANLDNSGSHPLTIIEFGESGVRFNGGGCEYVGAAVTETAGRLSGTVNCTLSAAGRQLTASGNWQAVR
jgi:hypothetical protein